LKPLSRIAHFSVTFINRNGVKVDKTNLPINNNTLFDWPFPASFYSFQVRPTVGGVGHRSVGPRRRVAAVERSVDAEGHRAKRDPAKPKSWTLLPAQVPHGKTPSLTFFNLCIRVRPTDGAARIHFLPLFILSQNIGY